LALSEASDGSIEYLMNIKLKHKHELNRMKHSAAILRDVFQLLLSRVKAGVTTGELDDFTEKQIRKRGGYPAFKGVRGRRPYPATLCVSINDEIVHGIPGPRVINDGDIVSIDCGVVWRDYYSDAAITVGVGDVPPVAVKLMDVTRDALKAAIEKCIHGNHIGDISSAIQTTVESAGFNVVRDLYGHGIGKGLHEDPPIHNFGTPGEGPEILPGMVLAIEVMSCQFGFAALTMDDDWTVKTADGGLSAHFEDTIVVTKSGCENITGINP
jgi:methionyl aminopeptidase